MAQDLDPSVDASDTGQVLARVESRVEKLLGEVQSLRAERDRLLDLANQHERDRALLEARIDELIHARRHARQEVDDLLGTLAAFEKRVGSDEHA